MLVTYHCILMGKHFNCIRNSGNKVGNYVVYLFYASYFDCFTSIGGQFQQSTHFKTIFETSFFPEYSTSQRVRKKSGFMLYLLHLWSISANRALSHLWIHPSNLRNSDWMRCPLTPLDSRPWSRCTQTHSGTRSLRHTLPNHL